MLVSLLVQSLELDHLLLLQEELNQIVSELKLCHKLLFNITVPTAPPINCTNTTFFSRNVSLSWNEPVRTGQNGRAVGYNLTCNSNFLGVDVTENIVSGLADTLNSTDTVFTITDIGPHSYYTCNLSFINTVGQGPSTQCSFTTAQDSKRQNNEFAMIDVFYSTYSSN